MSLRPSKVRVGPTLTEEEATSDSDGHPVLLPKPDPKQYIVHQSIPNTPFFVSFISTILGGTLASTISLSILSLFLSRGTLASGWTILTPQLGLYLSAWSLFHILEFWTTAICNPNKLSVDAFLLNNGKSYHFAHMFGLAEYVVRVSWSRGWRGEGVGGSFENAVRIAKRLGGVRGAGLGNGWYSSWLGGWWSLKGWWTIALPLLLIGQLLRSSAMIQAAQSFSHIVSRKKKDDHVLVTDGIYRYIRHPSYAGFFYWAIATQLLLGNVVSTIAFAFVLGKFFGDRIVHEEISLVEFFGQDYVDYRKRVGTMLPWGLVRLGPTAPAAAAKRNVPAVKVEDIRVVGKGE